MEEVKFCMDKKKLILKCAIFELVLVVLYFLKPTSAAELAAMIFFALVILILFIYGYYFRRLAINKEGILIGRRRFISWEKVKDVKVGHYKFNFLGDKQFGRIGPYLMIFLKPQEGAGRKPSFLRKIFVKRGYPITFNNKCFPVPAKDILKIITENYFTPAGIEEKEVLSEANVKKGTPPGVIITGLILLLYPLCIFLIVNFIFYILFNHRKLWSISGFLEKGWFSFIFYGFFAFGIFKKNEMVRIFTVIWALIMGVFCSISLPIVMLAGYLGLGKRFVMVITTYYNEMVLFPGLNFLSGSLILFGIAYYLSRPKVKEYFR